MKFDIQVGAHSAFVDLEADGKGGFFGTITAKDFGVGKIAGVQTGDHLTGSVMLDGHAARVDATVSGCVISGRITAGWFFAEDFAGRLVA